jgi:ATP-dependent Clp protease ATP-binding subunit ClpC
MEMEKYNLVPRVKKVIETAIEIGNKYKHKKINNAHILCAIIEHSSVPIKAIFSTNEINNDGLKNALMIELPILKPNLFIKDANEDWWSLEIEKILKLSFDLSKKLGHEFIGIEHLIFCILKKDFCINEFLESKNFPINEIANGVMSLLDPNEKLEPEKQTNKSENEIQENSEKKFCVKYCSNLNDLVSKYKAKIEGRNEEISKLIEILSCKIKNNAILVGDAGVGKTAIVEGLAQIINENECPIFFSGFKIYSLDLGSMVAGTKYRGQFEERFKGLIEELKQDKQAILFIDEIHSIVGTGSTEGTLDLANMIKPALARGEIKCIGATTQAEYKKYFEKDSALNRRFQVVNIQEPDKKQTFEILKKAKDSYETFHGVTYDDTIINKIITLSEKYMPYRKFPDKAFDILDRIGARGKIEKFKVPQNLKNKEDEILNSMESFDLSIDENKNKCEKMLKNFLMKRNNWIKKTANSIFDINEIHILEIFSKISGLDIEKIKSECVDNFLSFKDELELKIFDQSEVINKIYEVLLCAKAGIKNTKKTIANFLFIGSTGVGKTYTAKVIAEKFYNKSNSFLQIDMAEYVDKNSISKLIGATAGYVGYEEGGLLSEFVRNNPFSLILFDEVEKAHPDIVNILLKIMDEGSIVDNFNRKIDFSNTIIVLTGNIGAETETARSMGFVNSQSVENRKNDYEKAVKRQFKPELISRLDEILIFNNKFSKEGLFKMISETIGEIQESLKNKDINLETSNEIKNYLYSLIEKDGSNARAVQKILKNNFELPLCKFLVSNQNLNKISLKIVDNDICFM